MPFLAERKSSKIVCPSDDETIGMVEVSWLGPPATEVYTLRALMILFDYLTDTAVAPLMKDFVQIADPLCSSVDISMLEQRDCEIVAAFQGVPVEKLGKILDRFFDKTVVDHQKASAFDVECFCFILDQQIRLFLSKLENNATSLIVDAIIGHQLYGQEADPEYRLLAQTLNDVELLKKMKSEPADFWHALFLKYFIKNCVCVMAEPSEEAVDEVMEKEEKRIQKQKQHLGEDGLKKCQARLDRAIHENTCNKPTDEELEELIVRELEHFNLINVSTNMNFGTDNNNNNCRFIDDLPMPAVLHNVPSDFVECNILIDTHGLPTADRHYMMLWFELMFQSPAIIDGQLRSYEEVAKLATKDLVSNSISVGVSGVYDRFISLKLSVDAEHYANLPKWAKIYLKDILFEPERVAICAKKLANNAADSKRDGNSMCHFLNTNSTYSEDANTRFYSYLALEKFHKALAEKLERSDEQKTVLHKLEELRKNIADCPINVHFSGELGRIAKLEDDWAVRWNFMAQNKKALLKCPADYGSDWSLVNNSRAITVGGSESAFLLQKTRFDGDWNGPNTMHTLLLAQYMVQCEGPLWNAVRGTGLAYDASVYLLPDRRALALELYRCSELGKAYERMHETVLEILGSGSLNENLLDSAKRSLICELIGGQSTVKLTAISSLLATARLGWTSHCNFVPRFGTPLQRRHWQEGSRPSANCSFLETLCAP